MSHDHRQIDTPFDGLSVAARRAWGKHDRKSEGWLPLRQHMADSAAVAGTLWDEWLAGNVKRLIGEVLPAGQEDGRRLVVWLAAAHDIGKATPAFACQVDSLAQAMRDAGLEMPFQKQFGEDRKLAPHGLAGQVLIQEWLAERYGWTTRVSGQFAIVAGGHHGVPPGHQKLHDLALHPELMRTRGPSESAWKAVQGELLDACAQVADVHGRFGGWEAVKLPQPVQVTLTALVIMSDWIASSSELFPYLTGTDTDTRADTTVGSPARSPEDRLNAAWRGLDLPSPWAPREPTGTAAELFAARFDLPQGAAIRPVQEEAVRIAREMDPAGLLIIEAPMGEGKTEAALAAAEILAARTGAGGCLIALPTRATGDAMFARLLTWLNHLPDNGDGTQSVFLAHAKAALNEDWAGLMRAGNRTIAAVDADGPQPLPTPGAAKRTAPAGLQAHQWLRGRKKGLLASFSVGTIDQVLFASLKSRHLALRHLALAGKVVVIDEVHAYDAYMNSYLERVLEWLAAYRVPVVLLSATLPAGRRRALAEAYAGRETAVADVRADAYPLLTAVSHAGTVLTAEPPAASGRRTDIQLEPVEDDLTVLVDRLERELVDGGCALVVRNTVDRVLEAAERLRERFGAENVTVAHSRFLAADRARKDAELLRMFGPDGKRPKGSHIVVASQVVEQSLDIDFDLLVTDLAPVDLMLQRMGRLHRHARRTRPRQLRTPRCLVTGADWRSDPPEAVRGSVGVYEGPYLLLRALAVLRPYLDGQLLCLPGDISPLVQAAYGEGSLGCWDAAMDESRQAYRTLLAGKRERAEVFRLGPVRKAGRPVIGWVDAGVGDADDTREGRAQVRDSEESVEVLVIQRQLDGTLATVPWLDRGRGGLELPEHAVPTRRAAEAVAASALSLPWHFSKPWVIDRTIGELEKFHVDAWQVKECPWLAGELVLVLDEDCQTRLSGFDLRYSPSDGLLVTPAGARDTRVVDLVPSFDLVSRPWLPVQRRDGTTDELSLRDVFAQAGDLRRLVGDVPTQEFALLRLLLAILHDAVDGPEDIDAWGELWESERPFAAVPDYLDRHRDRFDLLHASHPFFQVADLHTEKGDVGPLSRIVADVPNGDAFFSMRQPGPDTLSLAEAARWLVHAHAFDLSGIKSGAVGDPRVKGGRGYPLGVGWAGNLGGVHAEGDTLRGTLLLNLIAADNDFLLAEKRDLPAWRRPPSGPQPIEANLDEPRPSGPRDLYTWQSRRVRLHASDGVVTGAVLAYGDPLPAHNKHRREPMSGWRHSVPQEKKLGLRLVYMPRQHDPSRAAWRGLAALLGDRGRGRESAEQRQDVEELLPPGVVEWLARLAYEEYLPQLGLIRTRIVGASYGTQQSVVDEIVDDAILLPVVVLHAERPEYGGAAVGAVADADDAVKALGHLAGNLATAVGSDPGPPTGTARDLGFAALDGPYRHWLSRLGETSDPGRARGDWQVTVSGIVRDLGRQLLDGAGPVAAEGRYVEMREGGTRWVNDAQADLWFRRRLNAVLPEVAARRAAAGARADASPDGPGTSPDGPDDDTTETPE